MASATGRLLSRSYDVIVVGGGHNGLIAATYLARSGKRVAVLERRGLVGGAAVTEEIVPGYKFSRASYVLGLFRPHIMRDLKLKERGLTLYPRIPFSFTPSAEVDGLSLTLGGNPEFDEAQIRQFSRRDAVAYTRYNALLGNYSAAIQALLDTCPPDLHALVTSNAPIQERLQALVDITRLGTRTLNTLGANAPGMLNFLLSSAGRVLDQWFESDVLKATLATDAVIGAMQGPYTPQSAYVLLHHVMGGAWSNVKGGMGALSEIIAGAARAGGVEIFLNAPVKRVVCEGGPSGTAKVSGVECEDGTLLHAPVVVSNVAPQLLFERLLESPHETLPEAFRHDMRAVDSRSGVVKINVALDRLPQFRCRLPEGAGEATPTHLHGTVHFESSMGQLEDAYTDVCKGYPSRRPMVDMTIPSVLDPSLAPPGKHVALLFCQYAPYSPRRGDGTVGSWDDLGARDAFADSVFNKIEEFAPGFKASVVGRDILTPLDLERVFALPGGNIFHASMGLEQLFWSRPIPQASRYRTPVGGLYLAGAGSHPGGGVMGAPGHNAAMEILKDEGMSMTDLRRLSTGV